MNTRQGRLWLLVADGGQARILRLGKKPGEIEELQNLQSSAMSTPSRDLVSDASGRTFHVLGPAGHSKIARSDAHDQEKRCFAKNLVQRLEKAAVLDAFDRLVIVADPRTLGLLRKYMTSALSGRVTMELNLDLTDLPARELDQKIRLKLGKPDT
jgi:protein required for attachment to host cells